MNANHRRPTAEKPHNISAGELAELNAYLAARQAGHAPDPGEPGFPSGLAGELLQLAKSTEPDSEFAKALELQLQQAAAGSAFKRQSRTNSVQANWLSALWQSFNLPERKTTMKRLIPIAIVCIVFIAILWTVIPTLFPSATQTQVALVTPPTRTPAPSPLSPLTPTVVPPTSESPLAILFTPQPIPNQPPSLPSLVDALGSGYGGSGTGNLPEGIPVSLATALPESPGEVTAYYRLENTPLTLEQAQQIASQWGLSAQFYMPGWMQSITPADIERSYIAVDGMQNLSMWNSELSYNNLAISPVYEGHQYPQTGLPPEEQAVATASEYLASRGYLDFTYTVGLGHYNYGLVDFYRQLDGITLNYHAASVKIDPQGQVGNVWINREDYQSVGSYPVISAEAAWELLSAGQPSDHLSITSYPVTDGNPQYWGRVYPAGETAQLFGAPIYLLPADSSAPAYVQLNNLVLAGDVSGLLEKLESGTGYIHAWGEVQDVNGAPTLQLAGWEPFDEFSGYFDGTVRRTAEGDFLELSDGTLLSLPNLPADVPADIPLYAQGGRVDNTLEWFILQVHPADEGQMPADLSQAQAVIDKVELVYLAPGLNAMTNDIALDPSYRMLVPAWSFTGRMSGADGQQLLYQAYVQAVSLP
jgi:hypothetical protein